MNNVASAATIIEDSSDFEVNKMCKPDVKPRADQPIDCTVFVDNHGSSDARNVVIDDVALSNGTFVVSNVTPAPGGGTPGCTLTPVTGGQKLSCRLGTIPAATTSVPGRATLTYRISVTEGQDINNVAIVRTDPTDPVDGNNESTVTLSVASVSDLALTKSANISSVVAGTNLTYTLSIVNNGPSTAQNVVVADNVPGGVTVVSISGTGGSSCQAGTPGDPLLPATCTFSSLAPSATGTVTILVHVNPDTTGILHNDARVYSDTLDVNNANDMTTPTRL